MSKEAAERDYGAVFAGEGSALDRPATERRQTEMRVRGLPLPVPDEPPSPAEADNHHARHHHEHLTEEERLVVALSNRCCS